MGRIESVCSVVVAFSGVGQSLDDVAPVEAPTHSFRKFPGDDGGQARGRAEQCLQRVSDIGGMCTRVA